MLPWTGGIRNHHFYLNFDLKNKDKIEDDSF
jgi:hypothetical protein